MINSRRFTAQTYNSINSVTVKKVVKREVSHILQLQSFPVKYQAPYHGYSETDQYNTVDAINDGNIMRRKFCADFAGKDHLSDIQAKNQYKAGCKYYNSLLNCVGNKCSRSGDPKKYTGRIECIHKIARNKDLGIIPFPEFKYLHSFGGYFYLFKKKKIDTDRYKKNATRNSYFCFKFF